MKPTTGEHKLNGGDDADFVMSEEENGNRLLAASLDKLVDFCVEEFGKILVSLIFLYRYKFIVFCKSLFTFHSPMCSVNNSGLIEIWKPLLYFSPSAYLLAHGPVILY